MTEMLPAQQLGAASLEQVLIGGDLSKLSAADRVMYYKAVCDSVKLNPLTKPFEYITLNGKLTLYARRDATDQLRQLHKVSIEIVAREVVEDCYVVTARATTPIRQDESIGAVNIAGLKGDVRANAMMKAETKAKRRVTLSICGLGMLDETEVETIPGARITPSAGVEERLTREETQRVDEVAMNMAEWIKQGSLGDAVYEMENAALNAEQQIVLWDRFPSKERSAMKKEQARMKAAAKQLAAPKNAAPQVGTTGESEGPAHPESLPVGAAPEPTPNPNMISAAAHKRLEARISELKLDREAVKKYVKDTFGRDHFTEMTKEEYEKLDKMIEMRALKIAKAAQTATEENGP
jgi:hypothetical protein